MATDADLLAIENIRNLASALRGTISETGQRIDRRNEITGAREFSAQQTAQAQAFQASQQRAQIEAVSGRQERGIEAATETRVAGQEFRAGESELERAGALERANLRGRDQININIDNEFKQAESNKEAQDLAEVGVLSQDEETGALKYDTDKLVRSDTQGQVLRSKIIRLEGMSDEQFEAIRSDSNSRAETLRQELAKAGKNTFIADFLKVRPNESRLSYLNRVKGLRGSLIDREVARRFKKVDTSKKITGGTRGGATFEKASESEQAAQAVRVREGLIKEVTEEFGGE